LAKLKLTQNFGAARRLPGGHPPESRWRPPDCLYELDDLIEDAWKTYQLKLVEGCP